MNPNNSAVYRSSGKVSWSDIHFLVSVANYHGNSLWLMVRHSDRIEDFMDASDSLRRALLGIEVRDDVPIIQRRDLRSILIDNQKYSSLYNMLRGLTPGQFLAFSGFAFIHDVSGQEISYTSLDDDEAAIFNRVCFEREQGLAWRVVLQGE